MRYYLYPIFILIGVILGSLFPFYALSTARWSFLFLFVLLLLNIFPIKMNLKTVLQLTIADIYFLSFSYFFIPSLTFILCHILKMPHSLKLGFFMTSLAPFAIITPQFMSDNKDKVAAIRQILVATFTFPLYFALMLFLFFPSMVKFNILPIAQDSLILTMIPLILIFLFNSYFPKMKEDIQNKIGPSLPMINMIIIGILSFIFVGSSYLKNETGNFGSYDWLIIIAVAIFQDFGTYFLAKFFNFSETYRIVLSMKNVPFVGIFALVFFPQALFPTIMILIVHIFLVLFHSFNFQRQKMNLN